MQKVVIIHGCPSNKEKAMSPETRTYDKHWIPWTKNRLEQLGFDVETPLMPNPWEPVYEDFKKEFEKIELPEDVILIGHSCGTTFLARWLGETKMKAAKFILVGPWCIADKDNSARKEYYEQPIDASIKDRVKEITIFTADDEDEDGKKSAKIFHDTFGGNIIELKGHGHYTMGDMGTGEFPELLQVITDGS